MTIQAPDGAYIIGGGEYHFGQTLTEDLARAAFEFPMPTLSNMLELLKTVLSQLPVDALRPFKDFLGLSDADFSSVGGAVTAILASLTTRPVFVTVKELVEAITGVIDGDWSDLIKWFRDLDDKLVDIATDLQDLIGRAVDFVTSGDLAAAVDKLLHDIVKAITGTDGTLDSLKVWFQTNVIDVINNIKVTIQNLIDGFFKLFGGVGTGKSLSEMFVEATKWMASWQAFLDGIWAAFTGTAGAGKTVAEALKAVTDWLSTVWQKLVDGITTIWKPGLVASGAHAGIQDVIDAITGILGVGQSAQAAADHANITLAAAAAAAKAGFSDEFDYPAAAALPAPWTHTGSNKWGPNGRGVLVWKGAPFVDGAASEMYVQTANPLPGVTATVTVVLSNAPHADAFTKSRVYVCVQCSPTDKSCVRWEVGQDKAQLQTVNAAGVATNVGAAATIPKLRDGDVLVVETTATDAALKLNNVAQATRPYTPLAGRHIGFGLQTDSYLGWFDRTPPYPAAELAGIAWHP